MKCWQNKAHERLEHNAATLFALWCKSKRGKAWRNLKKHTSPYTYGFALPDYHHDLIKALDNDDEEVAKGIMLQHFV